MTRDSEDCGSPGRIGSAPQRCLAGSRPVVPGWCSPCRPCRSSDARIAGIVVCADPGLIEPPVRSLGAPQPLIGAPPNLPRRCLCGGVGRRRHGPLDSRGGPAVSGRELAVIRTEEAHPQVAVVAGAVLGHGAFIDHDRTIHPRSQPVNNGGRRAHGRPVHGPGDRGGRSPLQIRRLGPRGRGFC